MCREREETINHVLAECKQSSSEQLRSTEETWQCPKLYTESYVNTKRSEKDGAKEPWDLSIQTDHRLEHNKPDLIAYRIDVNNKVTERTPSNSFWPVTDFLILLYRQTILLLKGRTFVKNTHALLDDI